MSKYVRQEKSQRKHPVASSATSLIRAPIVPAAPKERPGWKGPGFVKKAPKHPPRPTASSSTPAALNIQEQHLPIELQQLLLNIFRTTFPLCQDYEALKPVLQEIKNALSERDFERAFGRMDWLEAYTVRWSPNRALCYATVLVGMCDEFREEVWIKRLLGDEKYDVEEASKSTGTTARPLNVVCYGGGAAEIMALGAMLRHIRPDAIGKSIAASLQPDAVTESMGSLPMSEASVRAPILELHLVDAADWSSVISSLQTGLVTAPMLSKYASAISKANNASFIAPDLLNTSFQLSNILEASQEELASMLGAEPALITLFFTLNELYTSSVAKTAGFLLKLTLATPKNSLLLVIDSPDSCSDATVEKDNKCKEKNRYPMHYLMDMVLMEKQLTRGVDDKPAWEKLIGDESRWFKLEEGLKYPISLENIRFQVHLFRRQ
jgi:25S rRNA (uracil2843-N3)-methyltransferase